MTKTAKICAAISSVAITAAVIFGIVTRMSYVKYNPDNAVFFPERLGNEHFSKFTDDNVIKEVESQEFAFLVTIRENEFSHDITKTTAVVDKVVKGDSSDLKKEIVIWEPNFMQNGTAYDTNEPCYWYYTMNYINNIMQPGKQYLVFVNKVPFAEAYEKNLKKSEYIVSLELHFYSFPTNTPVNYYLSGNEKTYSEVKSYDYFCYTPEQRDTLENIRKAVLEKYL